MQSYTKPTSKQNSDLSNQNKAVVEHTIGALPNEMEAVYLTVLKPH